jgi:hypothetical protein
MLCGSMEKTPGSPRVLALPGACPAAGGLVRSSAPRVASGGTLVGASSPMREAHLREAHRRRRIKRSTSTTTMRIAIMTMGIPTETATTT